MAAEPQQGAISAAFPLPPPFFKSFTPENLENVQHYTDPSSQTSIDTPHCTKPPRPAITNIASLPAELRNLVPPKPPTDGKYRSFGVLHDIAPPRPKTPEIPTRENLHNLTERLMHLFHRYVQIMATNPSGELWIPQWEEIRRTLEEIHGVINEYRPHQARESLILRYEDQIKQVREETEGVRASVDRAKRVLKELGNGDVGDERAFVEGEEGVGRQRPKNAKERVMSREKVMWNIIEKEVGRA